MSNSRTLAATEYLNRHFDELVEAVMDRQLSSDPDLLRRFGGAAETRCREDNRFHLHYLTAALDLGDPMVFADYCGWLRVLLSKRGVAAQHVNTNLHHWHEVITQLAPGSVSDLIGGYVDLALRRLPEYADEPSVTDELRGNSAVARYLRSVLAYDAEGAIQLVSSIAADADSAIRVYSEVLQPAQREIGRLWQINAVTVAVEHYATAVAERCVHHLAMRVPPRTSRHTKFIGLCPLEERHCVGLQMLCDLARLDGWQSYFLGASVPTAAACTMLKDLRPEVIGISLATMLTVPNGRELVQAVNEAVPESIVVAGGRAVALTPGVWKSIGADAGAADITSALSLLDRVVNSPQEYYARRLRQRREDVVVNE